MDKSLYKTSIFYIFTLKFLFEIKAHLETITVHNRNSPRKKARIGLDLKLSHYPAYSWLSSYRIIKWMLTPKMEVRDCCAHILTETWLHPTASESINTVSKRIMSGSKAFNFH